MLVIMVLPLFVFPPPFTIHCGAFRRGAEPDCRRLKPLRTPSTVSPSFLDCCRCRSCYWMPSADHIVAYAVCLDGGLVDVLIFIETNPESLFERCCRLPILLMSSLPWPYCPVFRSGWASVCMFAFFLFILRVSGRVDVLHASDS
jgi:hypothetical protein